MTTAYRPHADWRREDRALRSLTALQPILGPLVDGDLCEIRVGHRACSQDAVRECQDADGSTRLLCAEHVAMYFPSTAA